MASEEPLSNVDTAWLGMEAAEHPMMITTLMILDAPLEITHLRARLKERLLPIARFQQRIARPRQPGDTLRWEKDPGFDLEIHLQRLSLPPPGDRAALYVVVGKLSSTQLDLSRPLWQFHLVENVGPGCAIVCRVHHCLADGPALMAVLLALSDAHATPPLPSTRPPTAAVAATRAIEAMLQGGLDILSNPLRLLDLARLGSGALSALSKLLLRPPDPDTPLRGKLGTAKRVAWSAPIPLDEIKAIGQPLGATINDVMLAAAAGALRRYLQQRGEPVDGMTIRTGLSVVLRPPGTPAPLGNQAGAVLVPLPVGIQDPLGRLRTVKRTMDALKDSPEASLVYGLLHALGLAPPEIQKTLVASYCTRDTAMMANVPGPQQTIYLAGAPLKELLFWVPAPGGVGLSLNVSSYAGQVWLSVATDQNLIPDPETIVSAFGAELQALAARTRQPETPDPIQAMNTLLDGALATLDTMLKEPSGPPSAVGRGGESQDTSQVAGRS